MPDLSSALHLAASEVTLAVGALVLLMVGAFIGDKSARLVSILSVLLLIAAAAISIVGPWGVAFNGAYVADPLAIYAKSLIYLSAAVAVVLGDGWMKRTRIAKFEYPVLIVLASAGMGMMASSGDLISMYVGIELHSLALYVLAAFHRNDVKASEAGLKYFVLGALSSGLLLYGASLIYGFAGSMRFEDIAAVAADNPGPGLVFGLVFLICGLAFKVSAAPFHMWTPDVYEGAPTPVTTFFATAPKVAAMALTMRVAIEAFGGQQAVWQQIVIFVALASIILGGVAAIGQTNIKRLLAYSSINNVGFILIGLATGTEAGASAMMTYLIIYVAMTLGSFICVLDLNDREGRPVEEIAKLAGLSKTRPGLAAALAVFMFSLAGIPPLFGFWGKFVVFDAAVAAGLIPLAAIGIAASVIGAFYYLKVVKVMYFDEPADVIAPSDSTARMALVTLTALFVSPLGYFATLALSPVTAGAAKALFWAA